MASQKRAHPPFLSVERKRSEGDQLAAAIDRAGLKYTELARRIGIGENVISQMARGVTRISPDRKAIIAAGLGVAVRDIWADDSPRGSSTAEPPRALGASAKLPVIGAAPGDDDPQFVTVPAVFSRPECRAMIINSVSMLPYIQPGDALIFIDESTPMIGRVFAMKTADGIQVKEIAANSGRLVLQSWNAALPETDAENAVCLGYLIGIVSFGGALVIGPEWRGIDAAYIDRELRCRLPA